MLACVPKLIITAKSISTDEDEIRVRNHALFALVTNPAGPPAAAQAVYVQQLASPNFRSSELAACGLIEEKTNVESNHQLVAQALDQSQDAKHTLNMLYAIKSISD